jgi:hypothetical protein
MLVYMNKTMKTAYRMYRRKRTGVYYCENNQTREQQSLGTPDKAQAKRLLDAMNQGQQSSALNLQLGKAFITHADPKMATRTWQEAIDEMSLRGQAVSQARYAREFKSSAYATSYMPPEFSQFWEFDPHSGKLQSLTGLHRYLKNPVVLATPDGKFAMGIFAVPQKTTALTGPSYGYFNFMAAKVVKWNCVFNISTTQEFKPGDYSFRLCVPIGTLAQVETMLREWQSVKW